MNARAAADFAKHLAEVAEHASVCAEVAWDVAEQDRRAAIGGAKAEEPERKELSAREQFAIACGGAQEAAQAAADSMALIDGLKEATEAAHASALAAEQAALAAWMGEPLRLRSAASSAVLRRGMLGLTMLNAANGSEMGFPRATATESIFRYVVLLMLIIMLGLACASGYYLGYRRGQAAGLTGRLKKSDEQRTKARKQKKIFHDVEVQGPVRYMRHYETPRFQPLADGAWGSSVRATWIYETTGTTERRTSYPVD